MFWTSFGIRTNDPDEVETFVDIDGAVLSVKKEPIIPTVFALTAHPNPFNATITISYALPQSQRVGLHLYDMSGRLVESLYEGYRMAGLYKARWNAENISAGIYFVRMETDGFSDTRKIVLVK